MPVNPNDFEYQFSPRSLVETREKMSLSQAKLAARLDLPANTVSRWERGETTPDANSLAAIYSIAKEHGLTPVFFHLRLSMVELKLSPPKSQVVSDCLAEVKSLQGKAVKNGELGNRFKSVFEKHRANPQELGFSKSHLTKSLLSWLKDQNVIKVSPAPGNTDSVVITLNGDPKVTLVSPKVSPKQKAQKRVFTIRRNQSKSYECTVVGIDGQPHVFPSDKPGKDGNFTDEGRYRRAIEQAVAQNRR